MLHDFKVTGREVHSRFGAHAQLQGKLSFRNKVVAR